MKKNSGDMLRKCVFCVLFVLICPAFVFGAMQRCVPGEYPTIQAAIDASAPGDTVVISDGVYTGPGNKNLDFRGKAIIVRSENGPDDCVINCEESGQGFWFHSGEDQYSVLNGLTIMNASHLGVISDSPYTGGGIECDSSSPTIDNCIIRGNSGDLGGAGIDCDSSSPTITNCIINENLSWEGGGGVWFRNASSPILINCTISENSTFYGGGGVKCADSSPTLFNCDISFNSAQNGGGIACWNSSIIMDNCTVSNNTASSIGGGIFCSHGSSMVLSNCMIIRNSLRYDHGTASGISCYINTSVSLINCVISENSGPPGSEAIACSQSSVNINNCTVTGNSADTITGNPSGIQEGNSLEAQGSSVSCYDSSVTITNTILWGNTPGEICLWNSGNSGLDEAGNEIPSHELVVTYSNIRGGYAGEGNIDADPEFLNIVNGDYHLTANSPCIDKGTSVGSPTEDIEGILRPQGNGIDMGAYEFPDDTDNDGVADNDDNCPNTPNPGQADRDGDGHGDVCDPACDLDGDADADEDDYAILSGAFGKCAEHAGFIPDADYDSDGCISLTDYQLWYQCYEN